MLHTKTFMIALITAGCLAAPTASAGYPPPPKDPYPNYPKDPYPPKPYPPKHSCEDIKLKDLEVKVKDDGKVRADIKVKGLKKKEDVKVTFKAEGTAELKCMNNGGQFPKPHQKGEVEVKVSGWQEVEASEEGKAEVHIVTGKPEVYETCKNSFKPVLKYLEYDTVKVIVEQKECKVKFVCELDPPLKPGDSASLDDGIECYPGEVIES